MSNKPNPRPRFGLGLGGLAAVGAAIYLVVYRVGVQAGTPDSAVLVVLLSAAVWSTLATLLQERSVRVFHQNWISWSLAAAIAVLTLLGNVFATLALELISAPVTGVFQQTQVLFVPLLAFIFLRERLSLLFWLGVAIAVIGLLTMRLGPATSIELNAEGTALATLSAFSFAVMMVIMKRIIHQIHPVAFNATRLWLSVLLWFLWRQRWPSPEQFPPVLLWCGIAAGFVGPVFARLCVTYSLLHIPAGLATLMGLLTPVLSILPSYWVFGSYPSSLEVAGGALMTLGIALPVGSKLRAGPSTETRSRS